MFSHGFIRSIRVDDPNDSRVTMLGLAGWELLDVTFDPVERNWVMTFRLPL